MPKATQTETRHGVELSSLDQPLFTGAEACKRDLIDYLEAASEPLLRELRDRPLTVLRVRPGQQPFMQKNLPDYAPDYVQWTPVWSESGHREIRYPLCNDLRTLLWLGNQRAVEFHPTLMVPHYGESTDVLGGKVTHLVLDLDPPEGSGFGVVVAVAHLVRQALADAGLAGAVKTSGSKGLHVIVPIERDVSMEDAAAATRAIAARVERLDPELTTTTFMKDDRGGKVFVDATRVGGATVIAAYSPRVRPGVPVSFPVGWDDLDSITPSEFTVHTAPGLLGAEDPWVGALPAPQPISADLVEEGHTIPT